MNDQLNEAVREGMEAAAEEAGSVEAQPNNKAGVVLKVIKIGLAFVGGVATGVGLVFGIKKLKASRKAKAEAKKAAEEAAAEENQTEDAE